LRSEGKLEVIFDDGAKYLKTKRSEGVFFDGLVIDNSDVFIFEGPAASLFTEEFYSNIFHTLRKGAVFSQQVSDDKVKAKWESMVKSVGFGSTNYILSVTPEYSVKLPLGGAKKH